MSRVCRTFLFLQSRVLTITVLLKHDFRLVHPAFADDVPESDEEYLL